MNMVLGGYEFAKNPGSLSTMIEPARQSAHIETYDSVALFSWGLRLTGLVVDLKWELMLVDQYDAIRAIYAADAPVPFNPQDGKCKLYSVELIGLEGEYFKALYDLEGWRQSVTLSLLFLNEGEDIV